MALVAQLGSAVKALASGHGALIVIPSMTFDSDELAKIPGAVHFEERMLWLLQVLRNPSARVVYVTSEPLPNRLVDYSIALTGAARARDRVVLVSCNDPAPEALTRKVLARLDVQQKIRKAVAGASTAVMMCHVGTPVEDELAAVLDVPLFACPSELVHLGTKSASRSAFREAGVLFPEGHEDLRDRSDVVEALVELQLRNPLLKRAVIKLNDSFAGGGNAVVTYPGGSDANRSKALSEQIDRADFVAEGETPERYFSAFSEMGGIVEEYIEGNDKTSPSAQCILAPDGSVRVASTHEQILGGPTHQTYFGCRFPAAAEYNVAIAKSAARICEVLAPKGVTGHISIDFVCLKTKAGWRHYALEVNLRMGGATAPISFLESATGCEYDPIAGRFIDGQGRSLYYTSADRIQSEAYKTLNAQRLLDAADRAALHFDPTAGTGALFYMLGALPTVGKLGMVAIDHSALAADKRYDGTLATLDAMTGVND